MFYNVFQVYLIIIILVLLPILLKRFFIPLQIFFGICWLVLMHLPLEEFERFVKDMQILVPFWYIGSFIGMGLKQRSKIKDE